MLAEQCNGLSEYIHGRTVFPGQVSEVHKGHELARADRQAPLLRSANSLLQLEGHKNVNKEKLNVCIYYSVIHLSLVSIFKSRWLYVYVCIYVCMYVCMFDCT